MLWNQLRSPQLAELAQQDVVVVLPCGSIEQHGTHLPVDTDSSIVTAVAHGAAEASETVVVLPTLWYGLSPHHMGAGGTVTLSHDTYCHVVRDIVLAVAAHGFSKMVLLNGHGGNDAILKGVVQGLHQEVDMRLMAVTYWYLLPNEDVDMLRTGGVGSMGHGGEFETAIQLHLRGELVDLSDPIVNPMRPALRHVVKDLFHPGAATMIDTRQRSSGPFVAGDPTQATAEKGQQWLERTARHVAAYLEDFRTL